VSETKRILALDLGSVRIGCALSDSLALTAQPLETIRRIGPRKDLLRLCELAREKDVGTVVVGLPLLLSGEEGEKAAEARDLAEKLGRRLPGVAIEFWDERLTTVEAERTMLSGNVRRAKRKQSMDALAAVLILQGYLDSLGNSVGGDGDAE
jgi:putative Holliday junction resolvase